MKTEFNLFAYSDLNYEDFIEQIHTILSKHLSIQVEKTKYTNDTTFYCKSIGSLFIEREEVDDDSAIEFYYQEFGIEGTYDFYIPISPSQYAEGINLIIRLIGELLKVNDGDLIFRKEAFVLFKRTKDGLWANNECREQFGFDFPLHEMYSILNPLDWGNPENKTIYGNTFLEYGSHHQIKDLMIKAKANKQQFGQWTNDQLAADFIAGIAQKRGVGTHDVTLPNDLPRRLFLATGIQDRADMARVVVNSDGSIQTAYPFNSHHPH